MTFLPRSPVSSWSDGVSANLSTAACLANTTSSRRVWFTWSTRLLTAEVALREATGAPAICRPSVAHTIQAVPATRAPRLALTRWRTRTLLRRTTASAITVGTARTSSTATTATPIAATWPIESFRKDSASLNSIQSSIGLKRRSSCE